MATKAVEVTVAVIGMTMEKDYGAIKIGFSASMEFPVQNQLDGLKAADTLRQDLEAMFLEYEQEHLPKLQQSEYQRTVENGATEANWQKALIFRREIKGNKTYYNFVTPRYPKFGIAAWEECNGRDEMIAKLGDKNEMQLEGYRVRVDESGKYPKAVEVDLQF